MSVYRRAAKVDSSQQDIVASLEAAHVRVWVIRQPCDLLLQFWCNRHGVFCWQPLECKTATATGRTRSDKRQRAQIEFLAATNTPIVTSFDEAWQILNTRHHLGHKPV